MVEKRRQQAPMMGSQITEEDQMSEEAQHEEQQAEPVLDN